MNKKDINIALASLKESLLEKYGQSLEMFIFGSVARGDYSSESDIDILVVFDGDVNNTLEEQIFDIAYDVGLKNDVVFGIIVYSKDLWYSSRGAGMPLYAAVSKDGQRI